MEFAENSSAASAPASAPSLRREPIYISDDHRISVDHYYIPQHYTGLVDYLLVTKGTILDRVERLAADILEDYAGVTIHLICVLKGGSTFFKELSDAITKIHQYGKFNYVPFTIDFVRVKSYEGTESTGRVEITGCDPSKWRGKHIVFVEDIIDTGLTMSSLMQFLKKDVFPASVKVASLVEKRTHRSCGFQAEYVGFSVPDKFIIGYCLDYNEAYRDLGHIGVINSAGIEKFKDFENV